MPPLHPLTSVLRVSAAQPPADRLMDQAIRLALGEDLGDRGDVTTCATVSSDAIASARLVLKQPAVVAGLEAFARVCRHADDHVSVTAIGADGEWIAHVPCDIATIAGPARSILTAERLALNIIQRMSGVATFTRRFVSLAAPRGIAILDTRKTTPGLRAFEKDAVRLGGGQNHRFGLFDGILIKDNHVRLAGGVRRAMARAREACPGEPIEIEVATLEETREAVQARPDAILLDNMTPEQIRTAVTVIAPGIFIEVSGGVTLATLPEYLIPGVHAISIGALTHSAAHVDISLEIEAPDTR